MSSLKNLWGMVSGKLNKFLDCIPLIRPRNRKGISITEMNIEASSLASSLPEDIQVDIFLKLPLKSIGISRCVCKVWYSLLCNPSFIKTHLGHTTKHKSNTRLMLACSKNHKFVFFSIDYASILSVSSTLPASSTTCTCHGNIERDYPFMYMVDEYKVLGSCDGLIFIGTSGIRSGIDKENNLSIWNPSTAEYKNVRLTGCDFFAEPGLFGFTGYGFYYDCIVEDYKLVRIFINKNSRCHQVEVYTIGSGLLKTTIQSSYTVNGLKRYSYHILDGAIYCLGFKTIEETSSKVIVSFDMSSEEFLDFIFPEEVNLLSSENPILEDFVEVMNDCLYIITYSPSISNHIEVWKMKDYKVRESVTKFFSLTTNLITDITYLKLQWSFANGEVLIECGVNKFLYDPKNNQIKKIEIQDIDFSNCVSRNYVDSLVSPNSGTYA